MGTKAVPLARLLKTENCAAAVDFDFNFPIWVRRALEKNCRKTDRTSVLVTSRQGWRVETAGIFWSAQEKRTSWVAFLLVTFLSAKQRKVTRQRAKTILNKNAKVKTRDRSTKLPPLAEIGHWKYRAREIWGQLFDLWKVFICNFFY